MTALAARAIAAEQIRFWHDRGWTPEMAWCALHDKAVERNNAQWRDVSDFMVRWLLTGRGKERRAA